MTETPDARTRAVLREHDLPEGLLPSGLSSADIDDSGSFTVTLPKRVERTHGGYRVRFGKTIHGTVSAGRVTALKGVEAKQLLWFPVSAITADGDGLIFSVGPATRRLLRSDFPG